MINKFRLARVRRHLVQYRKVLLIVLVLGCFVCLLTTRVVLVRSDWPDDTTVFTNGIAEVNHQSTHSDKKQPTDHAEKKQTDTAKTKSTAKRLTKAISSDYSMYLADLDEADIQDPYVNKHEYEYGLNSVNACRGDVLVIALVHSAPNKVMERELIRDTWGSVRNFIGTTIIPMFLLGKLKAGENGIQEELVKESKENKDIVQGNFVDSYKNLTYKNIMGLHWVQHYCKQAKFVMKTDDDTLVDVYHLVDFLLRTSPDGNLVNFLYCPSVFVNQGPLRRNDSKWFVTFEEYPYSKYPSYCEGFAYIMSNDVSRELYEASSDVKPFWIDDVYVTGFLALRAGILHRKMEPRHSYCLMETDNLLSNVKSSLFVLAKYSHLQKNWDLAWKSILTANKIFD